MTTSQDDEQARFDAAVAARTTLIDQAKAVLPEAKFDALSEREIQELVLKKIYGDQVKLDDKSDAYVRGRWGHAVDAGRLEAAAHGGAKSDEARTPASPPGPDWMKELSYTRDRRDAIEEAMLQHKKTGKPPAVRDAQRAVEREFSGKISRGGVALDSKGARLPDWMQPCDYNIPAKSRAAIERPPEGS